MLDEEGKNFVPFDQTSFTETNVKAMALLIVLFERFELQITLL
jgi:hypothetical protein